MIAMIWTYAQYAHTSHCINARACVHLGHHGCRHLDIMQQFFLQRSRIPHINTPYCGICKSHIPNVKMLHNASRVTCRISHMHAPGAPWTSPQCPPWPGDRCPPRAHHLSRQQHPPVVPYQREKDPDEGIRSMKGSKQKT